MLAVLPVHDANVFTANCLLRVECYHTGLTSVLNYLKKKKQEVARRQEVATRVVITPLVFLRNRVALKGKTTRVSKNTNTSQWCRAQLNKTRCVRVSHSLKPRVINSNNEGTQLFVAQLRLQTAIRSKNALSLALALHHTTGFKRCKRQHANKPRTRCSTCFPKACKMCRDACQLTFTLVPGFEQLANEATPTPQATQLTKTQQHGKRPITALVLANDFRSRFTPSALKQLIHK